MMTDAFKAKLKRLAEERLQMTQEPEAYESDHCVTPLPSVVLSLLAENEALRAENARLKGMLDYEGYP